MYIHYILICAECAYILYSYALNVHTLYTHMRWMYIHYIFPYAELYINYILSFATLYIHNTTGATNGVRTALTLPGHMGSIPVVCATQC